MFLFIYPQELTIQRDTCSTAGRTNPWCTLPPGSGTWLSTLIPPWRNRQMRVWTLSEHSHHSLQTQARINGCRLLGRPPAACMWNVLMCICACVYVYLCCGFDPKLIKLLKTPCISVSMYLSQYVSHLSQYVSQSVCISVSMRMHYVSQSEFCGLRN